MASKKLSGSKKPARKKKDDIKDLSRPSQELSEQQAKAVKAGGNAAASGQPLLKFKFSTVF